MVNPLVVDALRDTLARHPEVQLAFVFGSFACGKERADSDVDVAVQAPHQLSADAKMDLVGDLALATGRAVDLIDLRTVGEPLLGQILAHGVRLLGDADAHGRLLSRHLMDAADFLPYAQRIVDERQARVDREVTQRKPEALRHCLQRLRERKPATAAMLATDEDLQDVLVLNLSRAIQVCVDIAAHLLSDSGQPVPTTMGETFVRLAATGRIDNELGHRLRRAVGFRNIAVHNCEAIDWDIVFALTGERLADFEQFALQVTASH